jgi:hypothetical protein
MPEAKGNVLAGLARIFLVAATGLALLCFALGFMFYFSPLPERVEAQAQGEAAEIPAPAPASQVNALLDR